MKFIKSNFPHAEHHFPPIGKALPGVILPRSSYLPHEIANGKRNVIALSDGQYKRLMGDELFNAMLKAGQYEFVDELPAGAKTPQELLDEKDARIAELEAQVATKGADKGAKGGKEKGAKEKDAKAEPGRSGTEQAPQPSDEDDDEEDDAKE